MDKKEKKIMVILIIIVLSLSFFKLYSGPKDIDDKGVKLTVYAYDADGNLINQASFLDLFATVNIGGTDLGAGISSIQIRSDITNTGNVDLSVTNIVGSDGGLGVYGPSLSGYTKSFTLAPDATDSQISNPIDVTSINTGSYSFRMDVTGSYKDAQNNDVPVTQSGTVSVDINQIGPNAPDTYICTGHWDISHPCENMFDESITTYASSELYDGNNKIGNAVLTYNKPLNTYGATFIFKDGSGSTIVSDIPQECWDYSANSVEINIFSMSTSPGESKQVTCFDGTFDRALTTVATAPDGIRNQFTDTYMDWRYLTIQTQKIPDTIVSFNNWDAAYPHTNSYDDDPITYGTAMSTKLGSMWIEYNKPVGINTENSKYVLVHGSGTVEIDIMQECWDYDPNILYLWVQSNNDYLGNTGVSVNCRKLGGNWHIQYQDKDPSPTYPSKNLYESYMKWAIQ